MPRTLPSPKRAAKTTRPRTSLASDSEIFRPVSEAYAMNENDDSHDQDLHNATYTTHVRATRRVD